MFESLMQNEAIKVLESFGKNFQRPGRKKLTFLKMNLVIYSNIPATVINAFSASQINIYTSTQIANLDRLLSILFWSWWFQFLISLVYMTSEKIACIYEATFYQKTRKCLYIFKNSWFNFLLSHNMYTESLPVQIIITICHRNAYPFPPKPLRNFGTTPGYFLYL